MVEDCHILFYIKLFNYSELTQIIGDVIADPTLPRTEQHPCPRCSHKESVFFQSHSTRAEVSFTFFACDSFLYLSLKVVLCTIFIAKVGL